MGPLISYHIISVFKNLHLRHNRWEIALFGWTSTQINCIGPMSLCANFHAFRTICKNFSPFTYTSTLFFYRNNLMSTSRLKLDVKSAKKLLKFWLVTKIFCRLKFMPTIFLPTKFCTDFFITG